MRPRGRRLQGKKSTKSKGAEDCLETDGHLHTRFEASQARQIFVRRWPYGHSGRICRIGGNNGNSSSRYDRKRNREREGEKTKRNDTLLYKNTKIRNPTNEEDDHNLVNSLSHVIVSVVIVN